jgi:lipopolysaccharide/colanic/teichoic acid biosynthesis glycosyltransferase
MPSFLPVSRANWVNNIAPYDVFCAAAAPWLAFALRDPRFIQQALIYQGIVYWCISLISAVLILYSSGIGGIIAKYFSAADGKRVLLAAFVSVSIASMVAFTVTRLDTIPRSLPIIQFFLFGSLLVGGRLVGAGLARGQLTGDPKFSALADENIIVVGANLFATCYLRLLEECGLDRKRVLAIVDPNPKLRNLTLWGRRVIGTPEELPVILSEYKTHGIHIRRVVVAIEESFLSPSAQNCLRSDVLLAQGTSVEFLAERLGLAFDGQLNSEAERTKIAAEVQRSSNVFLDRPAYWRLKRAIDVIVAGSSIILLLPLLILAALAVRIAIGSPVIFWQRRVGRDGSGVFVLKFRTMYAPFDSRGNFREQRSDGLCFVGALLRHTHIDELPQLFNILRGDMSLIGPRPLLPEDQPTNCGTRLLVRPGITGWAQVNGGSLIAAEEKNILDEYYVHHASLWLDAKIALKTIPIFITGDRPLREPDAARLRNAAGLRRA